MRLFLIFISLLIAAIGTAQKVKVLEYGSSFPIENVTIYNDSNSTIVYTNRFGIADLSAFLSNDIISFNHISFFEYEILKKELGEVEYVIYLTKKAEQLDEIVLSASKGTESRSRIAEQIATTTKFEIKKLAPQTSADLLASMPGIKIQKTQAGGGSPVLRGMEANRVLLVVDGVRLNNAIYRTGHLQNSITVSPNSLERTEVIFGPSSVIYGSDALGGVIHYYTKSPKIRAKSEVNSSVYSRFSSVNKEFTFEGNIEISQSKWASFTSFSRSNFGDVKIGKNRPHGFDDWGKVFEYSNNTNTYFNPNAVVNTNENIQKNTGYNQTDLLQKVLIPINSSTELLFNLQYSTSSNIDNFSDLTEYSNGTLKNAESYYGPQNRLLLSSQIKINPNLNWLQNGEFTLAYQGIEESRIQRKFGSLNRTYRIENVDVLSLNGDFHVPLTESNNRILSYGFEITHNKVNSNAYGKVLHVIGNKIIGFDDDFVVQSRYPDGGSTYSSLASYINYRQNINKNTTLNSGLRYVNTRLNAKWLDETFITLPSMDISSSNSALTATVGLSYKPAPSWQLNSVVSSGFRSPNIDDIGKIREKSGNVTVPNTSLKPEYAYNFEVGASKYFNDKKFQTGVSWYYTLLTNYITRDFYVFNNSATIMYDNEIGNTVANVNKGNAYIYGGTVNFLGELTTNFITKGSVTYTKGKAYDTNEPMSSIPPLFGSIEIGYNKDRFYGGVNWRYSAKKRLKDYNLIEGIDNLEQTPFIISSNSYAGTPKWNTLNFNMNYRISNKIIVYTNLDNIFDVHYFEFASGVSAPGRNLSVALQITL